MPRVKIDRVVSFSSEDPDNEASNLLSWDVSKKKWLCCKPEESCSVVLQLARSTQICAVQVGAHLAAMVEVLVGRSETPDEPFQVLVPRSVFLSPSDSRRVSGSLADRVRSFGADSLADSARYQRWDRLRVVCSQPYNKHCKFGLSFIHIQSPEGAPEPEAPSHTEVQPSQPSQPLQPSQSTQPLRFSLEPLSDDEEFSPGELFAKHRNTAPATSSSDAQIRQATSHALKNIPDSSIKLTRTNLTKGKPSTEDAKNRDKRSRDKSADDARSRDRTALALEDVRTDDQASTSDKQKENDQKEKTTHKRTDESTSNNSTKNDKDKTPRHKNDDSRREGKHDNRQRQMQAREKGRDDARGDRGRDKSRESRDVATGSATKRPRTGTTSSTGSNLRPGPRSSSPHRLLSNVVFTLSGYINPHRSKVRDTALALGARYVGDWSSQCTHLICAFPKTPKLTAVRSSPNGSKAVVVRAEWVEAVAAQRRMLPWQWYATEHEHRVTPTDDQRSFDSDPQSECDTDDEIERVRRKTKKRRDSTPPAASPPRTPPVAAPSPRSTSPPAATPPRADTPPAASSPRASLGDISGSSDVTFVRDERIQGSVQVVDSDSDSGQQTEDEQESGSTRESIDSARSLPDLFQGRTFAVTPRAARAPLARYLQAYGGLVIDDTSISEDGPDYVVSTRPTENDCGGTCVSPAWVWRCHAERRLCPIDD